MAIAYNGTNEYSAQPVNFSLAGGAMSIALMLKTSVAVSGTYAAPFGAVDAGATTFVQFYKYGGPSSSNVWEFWLVDTSSNTTRVQFTNATLRNGLWHRLVLGWNGSSGTSSVSVYVDGASQSLTYLNSACVGAISPGVPLHIGRRNFATPLPIAASVADFGIMDGHQMTQAEALVLNGLTLQASPIARHLTSHVELWTPSYSSADLRSGGKWTHANTPALDDHPPLTYPGALLLAPAVESPTVTGSGSPSTQAATCSGSGTVTPPAFTGTGDLATEAATTAGTGTSAVPEFAGSGTLATQAATADGSASSTPPAFSGSGTLATQATTAAGSGASSVPEFAGTGAVATPAATASGSGEASVPAFSGSGTLLLEGVVAAAVGEAASPAIPRVVVAPFRRTTVVPDSRAETVTPRTRRTTVVPRGPYQ